MSGMEKSGFSANGKAAVVAIDNRYGIKELGIPPGPLDEAWKQVIVGLFSPGYDTVIIVTGHHTEEKDNPVVNALAKATSRFGTVDFFGSTHTGSSIVEDESELFSSMRAGLVQLLPEVYLKALSLEQRKHLRLFYSMGCYDGNEVAKQVAFELGFKNFVGHPEAAPNFIATYPFLARLLGGKKIKAAVDETNAELSRCLPQVGQRIDSHIGEIRPALEGFLDCSRAAILPQDGVTKTPEDERASVIACAMRFATAVTPAAIDIGMEAANCMPSTREAISHLADPLASIKEMLGAMEGGELKEYIGFDNKTILEHVLPKSFREKGESLAAKAQLVSFGQDISFQEHPAVQGQPSRKVKIGRIMKGLGPILQKDFGSISEKDINIGAISIGELGELGAKKELKRILENCQIFGFRLLTSVALARLGERHYLVAKLKEAKSGNEKDNWGLQLSKVLMKNGFAKEAWQTISDSGIEKFDCYFLLSNIFYPLLVLGMKGKIDFADPAFKNFELLFVDTLQRVFEYPGSTLGEVYRLDQIGSFRPDLIQKALARVEDEKYLKRFYKRNTFFYTIALLVNRGLMDEEKAHKLIGVIQPEDLNLAFLENARRELSFNPIPILRRLTSGASLTVEKK